MKYKVDIRKTVIVEADSEEEAEEQAFDYTISEEEEIVSVEAVE